MSLKDLQAATIAVRSGIESDSQHGAVVPPIYLSSNYSFADFNQKRQFDYSRSGNPTRHILAEAIANLEHGAGAVITNTGMSAVNLVTALLEPGDLLVAPHDCYGGSYRLFDSLAKKNAFDVAFVDQNDQTLLAELLAKKPKVVWLETPSNPLLRIVDIKTIAEQAHAAGALVVVDNTFLSPALQTPILLGADIVVHSATKYINGHSDVVAGMVVAATEELAEQLAWWANCLGLTGSAFDSYLTLRGLRTLKARMNVHQENAQAIVACLQQQGVVGNIYYPGLPEHPGHALAQSQQRGFGAMLSFELELEESQMVKFLKNLQLFSLAESLGGVESLIAHPATMTHAAMSAEALAEAGISNQLLRVSVGLEDAQDLVNDLQQAFASL
ncbi:MULTISPECIES: cystathionine gamma-synthase [unclassified Agarivorans]|uniref:cystathionine gamma-synthase n=1 Tax=unclassified Agarivorans TaxID=2636026 RepID=UPI0026E4751B|nr:MULTISPECIES: cystathionine gamma-synthase [unclassified Agarivorans]MDO6687602.1 cystathionine gamma-synthase [Agarivorans sp. 3_MG-2023]MDO6717065.1 cystathionine gamma-synthase [Agarivorans sp. 2_MG-2023]